MIEDIGVSIFIVVFIIAIVLLIFGIICIPFTVIYTKQCEMELLIVDCLRLSDGKGGVSYEFTAEDDTRYYFNISNTKDIALIERCREEHTSFYIKLRGNPDTWLGNYQKIIEIYTE